MKDQVFYSKKTLNVGGRLIDLHTPIVMGILNITPDSFFDGGRYLHNSVKQAEKMLKEGATIIDVGGYSTRLGATDISEQEEIQRVVPVIRNIRREFPDCIISIDTFRASVARAAVESGAVIVNDVSGGSLDAAMFETVAQMQVPYILMHMRGTPQTMTKLTDYNNVLTDLMDYFNERVFQLRTLGVKDIIIDPGFGFAKTRAQNYELLKNLSYFRMLNLPILTGVSRKSMVWKTLDITSDEALNGTTVLNTLAVLNGASILRVHDVREAMEVIKLTTQEYMKV